MITINLPENENHDKIKITSNKKLGSGTYGIVYEIKYKGKPAALKIVNKSNFENVDELRDEIKIIQEIVKKYPGCKTKNLLCYIDISEDEKNLYFISDLMTSDLEKFFHKEFQNMSHCKKINFLWNSILQILDGLESLHRIGIVHRDIKFPNILIQKKNKKYILKIADFGISCLNPECKGVVGTPLFLPPRILFGGKHSKGIPSDDLYALATSLYMLMTGGEFITSANEIQIYINHQMKVNQAIAEFEKNYEERIHILDDIKNEIQDCPLLVRKKFDKIVQFIKEYAKPELGSRSSVKNAKRILKIR